MGGSSSRRAGARSAPKQRRSGPPNERAQADDAQAAAQPAFGPQALAGALLFATALQRADVDPQTRARLLKSLGDVTPLKPLQPGKAGADRTVTADALKVLVPSAAVVAAGFDPATVGTPAPNLLWTDGRNQLLVRVAEVRADLGAGSIVLTVPVACDETGPVDTTVTFMTGTPDAPAAGIVTTEDHPRGPATIVENWGVPIVAYAWHTLVVAVNSLSDALGGDVAGNRLVTAGLAVTADTITVTPMGRHTFLGAATPRTPAGPLG